MLAVGSALTGAGVLVVSLLALIFRHPRAPRWTHLEIVVLLIMVPVTGLIGFGIGEMLSGLYTMLHGAGDARELLALIMVPVVVALVWYASGIGRRLRAYARATADQAPVVPISEVRLAGDDEPPQSPAPGKPPRHPNRKAA